LVELRQTPPIQVAQLAIQIVPGNEGDLGKLRKILCDLADNALNSGWEV
jgi:hypothetical protein